MPTSALPIHLLTLALCCGSVMAVDGYRPTQPRALAADEIAVSGPGVYAESGRTYVLTADVVAPASAILLGKDTVLDLNGHSLTFAGAPYQPLANGSFEQGLSGWDLRKAPNAKVENRRWRNPIDGDHVCLLPEGEELLSSLIELPVADRPYYAMVAVADQRMAVDVRVEDEQGRPVQCEFRFGNQTRQTCPELGRSPKLGGGVVFALLFQQPAGKYRLRIRAAKGTCIIDDADIRPAMDYGVGIVGEIHPWAYYKSILDGDDCAFFDLAASVYPEQAAAAPRIDGPGTVTIRNGTIRNGTKGIRSWGILSTAKDCQVVIDNVRVVNSGVNAMAARIACGTLTRCRTELDWQWIIDRHRQGDYAVNITGGAVPSTVADCEFIGGQGQLSFRGPGGVIERSLFVNRQNVTNHYSIGVGSGVTVRHNRILPERGSGILVGRSTGIDIHDNEIVVMASEPINEYATEEYSVSAIRFTDYNANPDSPRGANHGNRIRNNRIHVVGRRFEEADPGYKPMAFGLFMSVGGGPNEISGNHFTVEQRAAPNSDRHGAYAIFVGGSNQGGIYHHNRILSNVTPVWLGTYYGPAAQVVMHDNHFLRAQGAPPFAPFRLGWHKHQTRDIGFFSNHFEGFDFAVEIEDRTTGYTSAYSVGWTLQIVAKAGAEVVVSDAAGVEVAAGRISAEGTWSLHLPQYHARGDGRKDGRQQITTTDVSSYRISVDGETRSVNLDRDLVLDFTTAP